MRQYACKSKHKCRSSIIPADGFSGSGKYFFQHIFSRSKRASPYSLNLTTRLFSIPSLFSSASSFMISFITEINHCGRITTLSFNSFLSSSLKKRCGRYSKKLMYNLDFSDQNLKKSCIHKIILAVYFNVSTHPLPSQKNQMLC